ncbi:MAG TPA: FAD-binding protein [Jatrophihabitans sp.]|nr:FAD-binding protein [Jatrophihabitans sp.]
MTRLTNWAGNVSYSTSTLQQPSSLDELRTLVAGNRQVRVLGTGHSFNQIADCAAGGLLVSLGRLPRVVDLDQAAGTVTVGGGVRYGELAVALAANGPALANLGSLPHISVAGACATGTHGSGDGNRVLADAVEACTLLTADGSLVRLDRTEPDFAGTVIGLGSLGVVLDLTLRLVEGYQLHQYVYQDLPLSTLAEQFDAIVGAGYSVSLFTGWQQDRIDQVWVKSVTPRSAGEPFFGARPAQGPLHPVPGGDPAHTTQQLGVPGPWHQRLPHFRLEFTPSSGDEIQSEYFVGRQHAVAAIEAVHGLAGRLAPVLQVAEIRTVAADRLWLSPCYRTDRVALHFTWIDDLARVRPVVRELEARLADFDAVPHWAKLFELEPARLAALHPRLADFGALARRFDPAGKFGNAWTRRYLPELS